MHWWNPDTELGSTVGFEAGLEVLGQMSSKVREYAGTVSHESFLCPREKRRA